MNTQKGFLFILLMLLIIGGGVYFYNQKGNLDKSEQLLNDESFKDVDTVEIDNSVEQKNINEQEGAAIVATTKNFTIARKYDSYIYLFEIREKIEDPDYYYKTTDVDKFNNYKIGDAIQVTAGSYSELPVAEEDYVGIRDYTFEINRQISNIQSIKLIVDNNI